MDLVVSDVYGMLLKSEDEVQLLNVFIFGSVIHETSEI